MPAVTAGWWRRCSSTSITSRRINDTLGHEAGDYLLQQVAGRLRASCREREDEVGPASAALDPEVARLGGDEFTVIMPGLCRPGGCRQAGPPHPLQLAHPFRLAGREIFANASIGIRDLPLRPGKIWRCC
jgi:diguanylate cyclase (GGDEF)-like protein